MPSKTQKPIDIDALIAEKVAKNLAEAKTAVVTIGGRQWHVADSTSAVALLSATAGDTAGILPWLYGYVAAEERDDFERMLNEMRGLDGDVLNDILTTIVEAVTGRPTEPTPDSSPSSGKRVSVPSTAPSSSTAAVEDSLD